MDNFRWPTVALLLLAFGLAGWWLWPRAVPQRTALSPHTLSQKRPFYAQTFPMMGTHISMQTRFSKRVEAYAIVFQEFRKVDRMMSEWKPGSPLAAVNKAAGVAGPEGSVQVPKALFGLLQRCHQIGVLTEGAFDMSWAAMWGLWNFKKKLPVLPSATAIAAKRKWVNFRKVVLDAKTRRVRLPHASMKLGLGGIAKGYALQKAATELKKAGLQDFLLVAGGHVLVAGRKHGALWSVGIRDPRGTPNTLLRTLELTNTTISTSGDYEKFFMHKGKRYHHIIDPRTGYPAQGVRSATVISPDATLADALSTAFMILPVQKSLAIAKRHKLQILLVDSMGKIHKALDSLGQGQLGVRGNSHRK